MTDPASLERRYRRLLACYPRAFRREHTEEMLAVLMAGARQGRRPSLAESADRHATSLPRRAVIKPGPAQTGLAGRMAAHPADRDDVPARLSCRGGLHPPASDQAGPAPVARHRSEEHTSELQS